MSDVSPVEPGTPRAEGARQTRYWFPIGVIVLAVLGVITLETIENVESLSPVASRLAKVLTPFLARVIVIGVSLIALALWFLFFSPLPRRTRFSVAVAAVAAFVAFRAAFKIEGFTGDIVPRVRARWLAAPELQQVSDAKTDLTAVTADDFPEYLGPGRRATVGTSDLARDWSAEPPKQLWRQPIGAAWSSFAVVGPYAVTQEQRGDDENEESVTCYELATGKLRWAYATPGRFSAALAGVGPRATPTIHEGRVYALGALGHLVCLDGETGKPIWHRDIIAENGADLPQWGKSSSPLIHDGAVIVSAGGPAGKSLVAYDKLDGKPLWSAGDDASSYSSPTLLTLCGVPQIVNVNQRTVTSHDPSDGHILWDRIWPDKDVPSPNVSQPLAVGDDQLLLSKGYGVGSALWQVKRDGDKWSIEQLWRNNNMKTKMTNAVVRDGFVYGLDEGILSCIEASSGAKKWKKGKFGHGQLLLVGDLLLVQSEQGDVALVEANPAAFKELTRFSAVSGQSWNCPAISGRKLLVRTDQEAACYELPAAGP